MKIPSVLTVTRCKLCAAPVVPAFDLGPCTLLECTACGFRFIDYLDSDAVAVQPGEAEIARNLEWAENGLESNRERIAGCVQLARSSVRKGPVLDVGAGAGAFLELMVELFPESEGIELSPVWHEISRRRGVPVRKEPLESPFWERRRGTFGGITMWDVIEHVNDPRAMARVAFELLRPGGVFLLDTPTRDGFLYKFGEVTARLSRGRLLTTLGIQYSPTPFDHKQIFRAVDMDRMLREAGFTSVKITEKRELSLPTWLYLEHLLKSRRLSRLLAPLFDLLLSMIPFKNKMIVVAVK